MQSEPVTSAPNLVDGRPVNEVLLPVVPGSLHERAVPLAMALAGTWNLPVRLVHVSSSISSVDEELDEVLKGIRSWYPDVEVTAEHVYGDDPARAIAQELRPQTLPVLATDHIDKWRFKESVAEALINTAGLPVLVVGPNVTKAAVRDEPLDGPIVVGLDGSEAAESAVGPALALAQSTKQGVWLVTVVAQQSSQEVAETPNPGRYLQELTGKYDHTVSMTWEVIQGNDPVEAVQSFAARRGAKFLVLTTKGRTDPSHHSMASITSGLAAAAVCPVLVLKSAEAPTLDIG